MSFYPEHCLPLCWCYCIPTYVGPLAHPLAGNPFVNMNSCGTWWRCGQRRGRRICPKRLLSRLSISSRRWCHLNSSQCFVVHLSHNSTKPHPPSSRRCLCLWAMDCQQWLPTILGGSLKRNASTQQSTSFLGGRMCEGEGRLWWAEAVFDEYGWWWWVTTVSGKSWQLQRTGGDDGRDKALPLMGDGDGNKRHGNGGG